MFRLIGLTLCLFVEFSIMDSIWRLTIFCAVIFIGSTYASYCDEGQVLNFRIGDIGGFFKMIFMINIVILICI